MNNILMACSTITGTDVRNKLGEDLGVIKDLMIHTYSGKIDYAVLSFGGFLGVGDKYFAIPWNSFAVDRENEVFTLDVTKEQLKTAPGFDKDNWPDSASPYFTTVNQFYEKNVVV